MGKINVQKPEKTVYEPHIIDDPLVPFVLMRDSRTKGEDFPPNWHSNLEILICYKGQGTVRIEDGEYSFKEGEIFTVNSGILHAIVTDEFIEYDCFLIDVGFCVANGISADRLVFKEKICDKDLFDCFNTIRNCFTACDECRVPKLRMAVLDFLIRLKEGYTVSEERAMISRQASGIDRIKRAVVYMRRNLHRKLTLDEIAGYIGVSKYYFTREFKNLTGKTLFEYINILRCKEARRLIMEGTTVSEAALACGFDNLSYFTRTYKKYMGTLPSKLYRQI